MLNRDSVINKAIKDCLEEMYQKSQPAISFYQLLEDSKSGKISKDENFYEQHYLSEEEFKYIIDKYEEAYAINPTWNDNIDFLKEYLEKGGLKDKYIKEYTDEYGNFHTGQRVAEEVAPLKDYINEIIYDEYDGNGEIAERVANDVTNKVFEIINNCQKFYKFDKNDIEKFTFSMLNWGPCSNKDTVKEYWKSKGVDIEFEDRTTNPDDLWEIDNYGHILSEEDD